jgi:hypothetical protein
MATRKNAKERAEHKRGLVRVIGFLTVVGLVSAGFSIRAARAEVGNKSIIVGRQMMELADSASNSDKSEISKIILNGQPVYMASSRTDDDPKTVLDRYKKHCEENRAQSTELWRQLADANAKEHKVAADSPAAQMAESGGTLAGGNDNEGTILCFVKAPETKPNLKEALATLAETGELNAVGLVRYAYVKKSEKGSHVLAVWTNEKFNVKEFVPEGDKDVPGYDFPDLPRPAESTRIFSIHMEGAPYGVNVYQSKAASPEKVVQGYDEKLQPEGWFALDINSKPMRSSEALKGASARLYEKDGAILTLVSKPSEGMTVTALGMAGATAQDKFQTRR